MAKYGERATLAEWTKFAIFKLGNVIGFTSPLHAALLGMCIWAFSWIVLPDSVTLIAAIPLAAESLVDAGIGQKELWWINFACICLGTFSGLLCWSRVAVLTMPDTFDRYKIKGISL